MLSKKKNKIIASILMVITIVIVVFIFNNISSDGMENSGIIKMKYQTFSKNKWSKWSKSGLTSGDLINPITNMNVKLNNKNDIVISYYTDENGWVEGINSSSEINNSKKIKAIKLSLYYGMNKNYQICYRTYNSKNKWMEWACDNNISGNKDEDILGIQIKIIPNEVMKNDYLKDYNKNYNANFGF